MEEQVDWAVLNPMKQLKDDKWLSWARGWLASSLRNLYLSSGLKDGTGLWWGWDWDGTEGPAIQKSLRGWKLLLWRNNNNNNINNKKPMYVKHRKEGYNHIRQKSYHGDTYTIISSWFLRGKKKRGILEWGSYNNSFHHEKKCWLQHGEVIKGPLEWCKDNS